MQPLVLQVPLPAQTAAEGADLALLLQPHQGAQAQLDRLLRAPEACIA